MSPDKVIRQEQHNKEWKPTSKCRKKLHRLANKASRQAVRQELELSQPDDGDVTQGDAPPMEIREAMESIGCRLVSTEDLRRLNSL